MLTLRVIRRKIRAAQKTRQITRTMQMVAASRLKKSEARMNEARPYAKNLSELLGRLSATGQHTHPYFEKRTVEHTGLIIVTSDRGLCGSYNASIIEHAESFLRNLNNNAKIILLGKKGFDYFRKREWEILYTVQDLSGRLDFRRIEKITHHIIGYYMNGTVDELYLLFTKYHTALTQKPTVEKFLNIESTEEFTKEGEIEYIFEPNVEEIFEKLLPRYTITKMFISLAEAFTSENAARMMAMKQATDNAVELIERLTLLRNKARQAAITKEITEIVTAAEALKA